MSAPFKTTAALLRKQSQLRPTLALVLGSGFQHALGPLKVEKEWTYGQLPGFPPVGVSGHAGKLVLGLFGTVPVMILKGRAHYYEGYSMHQITFPIRMMAEFGVRTVLLTNAAGGISRRFKAGEFMCLSDHINFMGDNPLRGAALDGRPPFVDLTDIYNPDLQGLVLKAAKAAKVKMQKGVYLGVTGPSYETPAEIRAFGRMGADAVGMSTVPEAIVARQCGLQVAAISCITNLAAGRNPKSILHSEVLALADQKRDEIGHLLQAFALLYGKQKPR